MNPVERNHAARTAAVRRKKTEAQLEVLHRLVAWTDLRIEAEVTHRPDVNIHKRTLAGTWNQVRGHLLAEIAQLEAWQREERAS